jgi:hypothetical protein
MPKIFNKFEVKYWHTALASWATFTAAGWLHTNIQCASTATGFTCEKKWVESTN